MTPTPSLPAEDVRAIVRLLGQVCSQPGDHAEKKRSLMDGLCTLIDADSWAWGLAADVEPGEASVHFSLLHGGFSDHTYAMFTQAYMHPDMTEVHAYFVRELQRQGRHITRLRQVADPQQLSWKNGAGPFWEKANIHGVIMSMYTLGTGFVSIMGLYRRMGAPLFSERDNLIAHIILGGVPWLHQSGWPENAAERVPQLSTRQRMTLDLLIQGYTRARIAAHLEISVHTANDYVKAVFQHFSVHSQSELIARFQEGDGGHVVMA